jgi:tetratricopeptide (TPR) repeat protein
MEWKSLKVRSDWVRFFIFLAVNFLLAYSSLPITLKLWIGIFGLFLPFAAASTIPAPFGSDSRPIFNEDSLPALPLWLLAGAFSLSTWARFVDLTGLSTWPNPDESIFAALAIHITRHWDWRFFYDYSQVCFTFPWCLALWFKLFVPSLTSLWLFPALLSALTIPLFYLASRPFFSRNLSLVVAAFAGLSYWGLYEGRVGLQTVLIPPFELLFLCLWGRTYGPHSPKRFHFHAVLLALATALGFYICPPAWLPLAFWFLLALFRFPPGGRSKNKFPFLLFGLVLFLSLLPFVLSVFRENYGSYIGDIKLGGRSFLDFHQWLVSASYVTGLFWGKTGGDYYGPYWGGLFDPLTASLFFMGALDHWKNRKNRVVRWVWGAFGLALLPGVLSANLEFFRVFLVFPFILAVAALGFQALASGLASRQRFWFFVLALMGMASLNLHHLFGPYRDYWRNPGPSWSFYKSTENFRAYQILQKVSVEKGPGYIFRNFPSDMYDQSLLVAAYPFNRAVNLQTGGPAPQWFAVLANDNYGPFLLQRFPGGRWFSLSRDLNREDGGLGLGLFPLDSLPPQTLKSWLSADSAFGETAYVFLNRPTGTGYQRVLQALGQSESLMRGDPFLESCFWEKAYYLYLQNSAFGDRQKAENFKNSLEALRQALDQGYPAAHLLNEYGAYLMMMGDRAGAAKAFQKSIQANPAFEPALENQKTLMGLGIPKAAPP